MYSEVADVMLKALVEDDVERIRVAFETGTGMVWLRGILEDRYTDLDMPDLIDEFQARGLQLTATKREDIV